MAERGDRSRLAVGGLQEVPENQRASHNGVPCTMATLVRTRFSVSSMSLSRCSPRLKHSASVGLAAVLEHEQVLFEPQPP